MTRFEGLVVRDEGKGEVSLVDSTGKSVHWRHNVPSGRNLFRTGRNEFALGTEQGYEIRSLWTGELLARNTRFPGSIALAQGCQGEPVLTAIEGGALVIRRLDPKGELTEERHIPGFDYARLITELPGGSFLVTANQRLVELDPGGRVIWECRIDGRSEPHAWQALRLGSGETLVAAGYAASLQLFDRAGRLVRKAVSPEDTRPFFYAGLVPLNSGGYLVANWQGHGPDYGKSGRQLLEFNRELECVGSWQQLAGVHSSIQGVIALEGAQPGRPTG